MQNTYRWKKLRSQSGGAGGHRLPRRRSSFASDSMDPNQAGAGAGVRLLQPAGVGARRCLRLQRGGVGLAGREPGVKLTLRAAERHLRLDETTLGPIESNSGSD
jgi:hypothetical protein